MKNEMKNVFICIMYCCTNHSYCKTEKDFLSVH